MIDQILLGMLLIVAIILFLWGRWRHDVVAFMVLVAAVLLGLVEPDQAFIGFSHPAVVTVALILVVSKALEQSGLIDLLAKRVAYFTRTPFANLVLLTSLGALLSGFMNNVGALALLMPLAMQTSRKPSQVLMPLSFGTILGGMLTGIGTPPNIIISSFREQATGQPFHLFDFTALGSLITLAGVLFLVLVGWRFIPKNRESTKRVGNLLKGVGYITEAIVATGSGSIGKTVRQLERSVDNEALVVGMIRGGDRMLGALRREVLLDGDVLILRADETALHRLVETAELSFSHEAHALEEKLYSDDVVLQEVVVKPNSRLVNQTVKDIGLRKRYDLNLLAIARHGERINERLGKVVIQAGDVLLFQGAKSNVTDRSIILGCLPLAQRGLKNPRKNNTILPGLLFVGALLALAFNIISIQIAFATLVVVMTLTGSIKVRQIYESVDWSVIVLLGALIPFGAALVNSGATATLSGGLLSFAGDQPPWVMLLLFMTVTMVLTNLINNAAAAVVMAPIAVALANGLGVSVDAFLMATAIAASSAFLTPIGHQNNVLVMSAGGYHFGDYWRLGLPLQIIILAIAVPVLPLVWGF